MYNNSNNGFVFQTLVLENKRHYWTAEAFRLYSPLFSSVYNVYSIYIVYN